MRRVRRPVRVPDLGHRVRHHAQPGRRHRRWPRPTASGRVAGRRSRVDVGGVLVGSAHPVVVQSMTNTDTADAGRDRHPGRAPGPRRLAARPGHGQHRGGRRGRPRDGPQAARPRRRRADHRRLPLQRPQAPGRVSRRWPPRSPSTGSTRATSARSTTTSTSRRSSGSPIEHDKPVRIGVNWGSLDQQILTELMEANARARRAARRPRRDDRGDDRVGDALRRAGRGDRPAPRPDHPVGARCPACATSSTSTGGSPRAPTTRSTSA